MESASKMDVEAYVVAMREQVESRLRQVAAASNVGKRTA